MAATSYAKSIAHVLAHEGGYVDHPADPGGATNMGITHKTLAAWRGRSVSKAEVKALTRMEAEAIYRANYWAAVKADQLPAGVDHVVFDAAVNSGPGQAARWLQRALGVTADGAIGPVTLAAAAKTDARDLIERYTETRMNFLRGLPTWKNFKNGWTTRVNRVEDEALALLKTAAPKPVQPPPAVIPPPPDIEPITAKPAPRGLWAAILAMFGR